MRKVITSIAAAAVALTSLSAVPAAAGNRNVERLVIGAGTILLLNELSRNGNIELRYNRHDKKYGKAHSRKGGKRHQGKHRRARLPEYCLTTVRKNDRRIRMYGARCLWNNYRHARFLPRHCKVHVKKWRHGRKIHRVGYNPRCLRRNGFRT